MCSVVVLAATAGLLDGAQPRGKVIVVDSTLQAATGLPKVHVQLRRGRRKLTAEPVLPGLSDMGEESFTAYLDTDASGYAISAETGATTWLYSQRASTTSLVATGGGLLFGGDTNGRFKAFDLETGEVLWEVNLGSPVTGYPITYAVDGRQYVAVSTGRSATTTSFLRLTPELRPAAGNNLFVFALGIGNAN